MALVGYSDSETSDVDEGPVSAALATTEPTTASKNQRFEKVIDRSESGSRKIKLDLPQLKPEPGLSATQYASEPSAKRTKIGGTFSGFNSLLPAPKRATQTGSKSGTSFKTSSEAAFNRNDGSSTVFPQQENDVDASVESSIPGDVGETKREEPKLVGKTTRFMPLSVASKKRKPRPKLPTVEDTPKANGNQEHISANAKDGDSTAKPNRSLFSISNMQETQDSSTPDTSYEPMMNGDETAPQQVSAASTVQEAPKTVLASSNSLERVASDLNLTPAQRRQLFGRNKGGNGVQVSHFNTEAEYAANEQLRQAGEVVEHRAVKAIAPGKHSLQQLVNNAKSQQDAMEDKWAAGRSARGEGGSKYGWN